MGSLLSAGKGEIQSWRDALRPGIFEITHARNGDWQQSPHSAAFAPERRNAVMLRSTTRSALSRLCAARQAQSRTLSKANCTIAPKQRI